MRTPPTTVVIAGVSIAVYALLFAFVGLTADGTTSVAVVNLGIAALLGVLIWRLWAGSRGAQITAVVVCAGLAASMLLAGFENLPWLGVPLSAAVILLLTVPRSAREFFSSHRGHTRTA